MSDQAHGETEEGAATGGTGVANWEPSSVKVRTIARALLNVGIGVPESVPSNVARLVVALYEDLSTGSPLSPMRFESLTAASGVAADVLRAAGARWLQFDGAGSLTGFGGLTVRPTRHRLVLDGRHLYLWCALDGLLVAHALGRPVRIETHCPTTRVRIEVAASQERVEHAEPGDAVMSVVVPESGAACSVSETRRGFCEYVNFFHSKHVVLLDSLTRPDAGVLTMDDAFALAGLLMLPLRNARI